MKPPSISDVAKAAGLSRSAVSRSFTPGASVASATRARVIEVAERLGYQPNLLARSLSRSRSRTIGIAVARLDNPFNAELLQQLARGIGEAGYGIRLFVAQDGDEPDPGIAGIIQHRVDALVTCAIGLSSSLRRDCAALGIPVVMVNRRTQEGGTCVVSDNRTGGAEVARFLIACGHRRFAFIGGERDASTSRDRETGFAGALAEAGLTPPIAVTADWRPERAAALTRDLLARDDHPDALFYANDHMAFVGMAVAEHELGLVPGRDLSIVGYDDVSYAKLGRGLTTFTQVIADMADHAVAAALSLIDGRTLPQRQVVAGRLIVRGSSAVPDQGCRTVEGVRTWSSGIAGPVT